MNEPGGDPAPVSLRERLCAAPLLSRPNVASDRLDDLRGTLGSDARMLALLEDAAVADLLRGLADHSQFLWRLVDAAPERCAALLDAPPETSLDCILAELDAALAPENLPLTEAAAALRRARQAVALLVALADLGGVWPLEDVTGALTRFADAAVAGALAAALRDAVRLGRFRAGMAPATCGLTVLALGKGGAGELNYSSDIDLVVLFDPAAGAVPDGAAPALAAVRLTQAMAKLLQEQTGDGFVLRVDLRLRPDPASTPVAVALPSAHAYYEALGQNWERAAFIKARPIAGDLALGAAFLRDLAPFIWRKYFDYAAIADIHAMKRQIHAVRGQAVAAVAGHDVKLGCGGIREIEFFVQTQQLIFGGRRPALRDRRTMATLAALAADGWIGPEACRDLDEAYRFLRTIEHRLQMVADQQTQRLPEDPEPLARLAAFAGFANAAAFGDALLHHLGRVQHHYARLFEDAPGLDAEAGSLVFTGTAPDTGTVATLGRLGFARPADAVELIRGWHFGRRPAVRSPRAREVLTELVPALVEAFGRSGDPDGALAAFDTLLGRVTAAVELLSLLRAHAGLRDLFADILGSAPRLAAAIAQRPHVLDALIDPALASRTGDIVGAHIAIALEAITETELWLDRMRDLAREAEFLAGVRALTGAEDVTRSQARLTDVADAMIAAALARAGAEMEAAHGRCPDGACVVLGMGRLGSREMTAASDLDLVVIYRGSDDSDGVRPLDPGRYHARLTQRLIAFLTAPTRRGSLYDVDLRLRPSGRQGPVAVRFESFRAYHQDEAQFWEHLALTRARVVAGDAGLANAVAAAIDQVLAQPRDREPLMREVAAMRQRVRSEKGDAGQWDMKLAPGGLFDLEFAAQALVLAEGARHPGLRLRHPAAVLAEAARLKLLSADVAARMVEAHRVQSALLHLLRFMNGAVIDPAGLGSGVIRRLCQAVDQPDLPHLEAELAALRAAARHGLAAVLGGGPR